MLLSSAYLAATLLAVAFGLPAERGLVDECPFIFNEQGVPSMDDIKAFPPAGAKPMDVPTLAITAALVLNNPAYIAPVFINSPKTDGDPDVAIPVHAKLLSAEAGVDCWNSGLAKAAVVPDSPAQKIDMFVRLPGGEDVFRPNMSGERLRNFDNADDSAWVALLQATMLHYAKLDGDSTYRDPNDDSIGPWSNVKGDPSEDYEKIFDSTARLQDCNRLGRMLYIATGKYSSQETVEKLDDDILRKILGPMSGSPVLVIPKEIQGNYLPSDRIWIGTKPVKGEDKWTFYNPVERKDKVATIQQLRDSAQDIIYITDHSAL
ncbi:hypothetical protein QFC21_004982 [Naganishia friedmannii]|uniref:Uncharacterized protein n=1 Tax=Naganishia friedmannii TaxID=89922 RepID=A0ACC2VD52_9TREE|nr:hypothetical protein QFC21_004982 [Naganishia friedmannii]